MDIFTSILWEEIVFYSILKPDLKARTPPTT